LTTLPNTLKFIKNTPLRIVFLTLFSALRNEVKQGLSCLIYYITYKLAKAIILLSSTEDWISDNLLIIFLLALTMHWLDCRVC